MQLSVLRTGQPALIVETGQLGDDLFDWPTGADHVWREHERLDPLRDWTHYVTVRL